MSNRVPLPAGVVRGKSYEYGLRVNVAERDEPAEFIDVRRLFGYSPTYTPGTSDARTYDDLGAQNNSVDNWSHAHAFSTFVNRSLATGEYLPEIEALRKRTLPTAIDIDAEIEVQFFHKPAKGAPNLLDAGQGFCTVSYQRGQTGADGQNETWNWTLTGVGAYTPIENPFEGWPGDAPLISSLEPVSGPAGELVTIRGTGFKDADGTVLVTGADGVKFGSANATDYNVVSATAITAIVPAGSAGAANATVKSTNGVSTAAPFSRTA
ncbi:IPT/TIG domain-containing protein [Microbacterium sp. BG28]|uniref:IPT/TIG domain-containing protein n=1 Tax=Microbacterium sp. BG28 TaxID=3097356 RepID=UPI002A5AD6FF|nr:IPT/TIG domain-containing protein [Microbacterium sp. BG28]MDY0830735.1 IPT/TIG domain-containing protein [Microbacterium sp. BG28]